MFSRAKRNSRWSVGWLVAFLLCSLTFTLSSFAQANRAADEAGEAQQAIEQGRLGDAEALLEQAVQSNPGNPNYWFVLGKVLMLSDKPKQAIPPLQKCLKITPEDWDARISLAQAYQKTDADAEAIRTLGVTAPPSSHLALWRFTRGFSLYRLGDVASAAPLFNQLLKSGKMLAPANFFLANCYSEMTQYQEAIPYYQTAIASGQSRENKALNVYYYNYGLTLFKLQRYDEAREAFTKSAQQFADDPLPWYFLGRCEVQLGHTEPARQALEMSIAKDASFNPAYYQLARLYAAQGNQAKAQELYGKVSKELHRQLQESERLKFGNGH